MSSINIPLLILDFIVLLPVTLLRIIIIYIYGSKYNITALDDIMTADQKTIKEITTNINKTINRPTNTSINTRTRINEAIRNITRNKSIKTSVDDDLDKLSNLVSGYIDQRKKLKKNSNKEITTSDSSDIINTLTTETETETDDNKTATSILKDTNFSFLFSSDKKNKKTENLFH